MSESKIIKTRAFADSSIGVVDAWGTDLVPRKTGVVVNLWGYPDQAPHCAEIYNGAGDDDYYAEIGLEFEGRKLVDYDGVFECPSEVLQTLRELAYDVSEVE